MNVDRMSTKMLFASICGFVAGLCFTVGFSSPTWLVKNSRVFNTFEKIGLWTACFKGLHLKQYYDRVFSHCRFVFHREYEGIQSWLEPAWFIAVQVFMTVGILIFMFALIILIGMTLGYCFRNAVKWLKVLTITCSISFVLHLVAVMIFAVRGDDPDWMPATLDANRFGLGYGVSVLGTALEFVCAVLFYVEWAKVKANKPSSSIPTLASAPPPGGRRRTDGFDEPV